MRKAVLTLLGEQPMHGYQLMGEIRDRSNGSWEPSPGSIYPLLAQLTDEGLVRATEEGDRKVFTLTDSGRTAASEAATTDIWAQRSERSGPNPSHLIKGIAIAFTQVVRTGTPEQLEQAEAILTEARRGLYQLLADE